MTPAHLSGITKLKKFIAITNFIQMSDQYHLVRLIVMYAFIRHCSFQICSHIHPKSFDAGLTIWKSAGLSIIAPVDHLHRKNMWQYLNFVFGGQVFDSANSYGDAVELLASITLTTPCYIIIGGAHPGEGVVITRQRTYAVDMWFLDPFNGRWVLSLTARFVGSTWGPPGADRTQGGGGGGGI